MRRVWTEVGVAALRASAHARAWLEALQRRLAPAEVVMLELVTGAWLSQAVGAACSLGVPEALAQGPLFIAELAARVGADPGALERLLLALCDCGVFARRRDGRIAHNRLSRTLSRAQPRSIADFVRFVGSAEHRAHWNQLAAAVRAGTPQVRALRGVDFFDYASHDPAFGAVFHAAMASLSKLAEREIIQACDFARFRSLVDIGGGTGALLAGVLRRHPHLQGVLFDRPEVVRDLDTRCRTLCEQRRLRVEAGSFFERVPAGYDAYLLKHVLHDFSNVDALRILSQLKPALGERGRLLVVEMVLPDGGRRHVGKLLDLEMLLCLGGRERTEAEFKALLTAAGLTWLRRRETGTPLCVLEAGAARAR